MPEPPFDPTGAVTFDLASGQVHLGGDAPLRVLVPADALAALSVAAGAQATAALGEALGAPMGKRVARRLSAGGGDARRSTIEAVVEHLGGELALAGLGTLGAERWGRALVLVVDQSPFGAAGDVLTAAVLQAALAAAGGQSVTCVPLSRDSARARHLVASNAGADKARSLLEAGTP